MTDLAVRQHQILSTYSDVEKAATAMAKSGYFQDSREMAQAVVKILAGQELGFGPFASMTGVYIIQGRPSIGANLMAAAVKKSGRYDYRVVEMSETACEVTFLERGKEIGRSRFTIEDARKAQTKNLEKFARNMLFARAISNGVRWYCPDVFSGSPVYTPEELGAEVDSEGNVLDLTPTGETATQSPAKAPNTPPATNNGNGEKKSTRPWLPETLREKIGIKVKDSAKHTISDGARGLLVGLLEGLFDGPPETKTNCRKQLTRFLVDQTSTKAMTPEQANALLDWMQYDQMTAATEANAAIVFINAQNGQTSLLEEPNAQPEA